MNKLLRYVLYILGGLILLLYLVFRFGMGAITGMSSSEEKIEESFANAINRPSFKTYEVEGIEMHYADMGVDTLPTIVFVHGSPGSWDAYMSYFADSSLAGEFRMISVDRVGYGKSSKGQAESSLLKQGQLIRPLLDLVPEGVPVILVGHSFGGPVIYRMGMEYPKQIDALLVLAGLADPEHESRLWIQRPFRSRWLRWLLPPDLDVSNREIVPLKEELAMIEAQSFWDQIQMPTTIIQGAKDMLVSVPHAEFAEQRLAHIPATHIRLPEENHFIVWTQHDLVCAQIHDLLAQIRESSEER